MVRMRLVPLLWLLLIAPVLGAGDWEKYVADDGGLSFHHPAGWSVEPFEGGYAIQAADTGELALLLLFNSDEAGTARESAAATCQVFGQQGWQIEVLGWLPEAEDVNPVALHFRATVEGADLLGDAVAMVDGPDVLWVSYMAADAAYDSARASSVLGGIFSSLAEGSASTPPDVLLRGGRAEELARAFVFVLEFALGDPLTGAEEQQVIESLVASWEDEEALDAFASYPDVVRAILGADREGLEELQGDLAQTTEEWLDESDPADPVVRIVRDHREHATEILVEGDTPLTAAQANAYSEMAAYSLLLRDCPVAMPEQTDPAIAEALRAGLRAAWRDLTADERADVTSAPAVWMCLRSVLEHGSPDQQTQARSALTRVVEESPGADASAVAEGAAQSRTAVENMLRSQVMLNINQMTFNQYMWAHGLTQTPFGW